MGSNTIIEGLEDLYKNKLVVKDNLTETVKTIVGEQAKSIVEQTVDEKLSWTDNAEQQGGALMGIAYEQLNDYLQSIIPIKTLTGSIPASSWVKVEDENLYKYSIDVSSENMTSYSKIDLDLRIKSDSLNEIMFDSELVNNSINIYIDEVLDYEYTIKLF